MCTSKRREEIERLLARRDREGLTYAQLAKLAGIRPSTMNTWAWRLRREGRRSKKSNGGEGFVEIVAGGGDLIDGRIEIELRGGRRITVPGDVDSGHLTRIVRALESC